MVENAKSVTIRDLIKSIRREHNLTQEAFGLAIGLPHEKAKARISNIESGRVDVSVVELQKMQQLYGGVAEWMFPAAPSPVPLPQGVSEPLPRYGDDCAGLRAENEQLRADNARLSRSVATLVDMLAACREKNH